MWLGDGEPGALSGAITDYDAIVLDVMLPLHDGLAVCRELRKSASSVPVLMLTARDAVDASIAGLDSGADDYLTKPYRLPRAAGPAPRGDAARAASADARASCRSVRLRSTPARAARSGDGEAIMLTAREYALLEHLVLHADEVVGRAAIAEHVWDSPCEPMSNVIDVMIQRLRRKIDVPGRRH